MPLYPFENMTTPLVARIIENLNELKVNGKLKQEKAAEPTIIPPLDVFIYPPLCM